MTKYDQGDLVRATGTFTNPLNSDAAVDPTTVSVSVRNPSSGTTTTYVYGTDSEVVRSSAGVYYIDIDLSAPGKWFYRWFSTGTGQAAGEKSLIARDPITA